MLDQLAAVSDPTAAGSFTTKQYVSISGHTKTGVIEQHSTWVVRWIAGSGDAPPRLAHIEVTDFEQVTSRTGGHTLFSDCTQSVLGQNASYRQQIARGLNHWLGRIQDGQYGYLLGNPGVALGDVNGDGLDDLYLCQEEGLPNRLYVQNADGTLRDESQAAGVDWLEGSRSALLVDLDNDGDQDLVVAILGGIVLAANRGDGRFEFRTLLPTSDDTMSLSAVDYDNDGRLDLYVCAYFRNAGDDREHRPSIGTAGANFVYHDANNAAPNSLFRNETVEAEQWSFREVTAQVGLDQNNRRWSLAAAWEDYDNDGDQDLYVGNDFGRNNLYRNDGGRFVDVAATAGVEDSASGMGITWGDFDRDGRMDLYVSNMFSAAGNRIAFQQQFKPDAPQEVRIRLQRFARGNTLLRNLDNRSFDDVSEGLIAFLQNVHDHLITRKQPLPIPVSFLIDTDGRIAVIYKGRLRVDDLLDDATHSRGTLLERFARSAPIAGRTLPIATASRRLNQIEARFHFATYLQGIGFSADAAAEYRQLIKLSPKDAMAHNNLGIAYAKQRKFPSAEASFRESLRLRPDFDRAHANLGTLLAQQGHLEQAERHFGQALRNKPKAAEHYVNLGGLLLRRGRWREAQSRLEQALAINPNLADAHAHLGRALAEQGRHTQAVTHLQQALKIQPNHPDARRNLDVVKQLIAEGN